MANLNILVEDGNNINVEVTPTPRQTISIDRGVSGVGIESVAIVYNDPFYFLEFTYTNGTTELVQLPAIASGVVSFNTRIGVVTLTSLDVTDALGYTPPEPDGTGATGTWSISVLGNAATVTNGVYTTGSYSDPSWLTALGGAKIVGNISGNSANVTGVIAIANGGTGATNTTTARSNLGLGSAAVLTAGAALGVATLDAGGTVPLSQIPSSVIGGVSYQGTWNASTNTPTLTSSVGVKGYYYIVSVAGNTNLDGITDWRIGDWAIFNGSTWNKIDNTDSVTSVNGYTGSVVLAASDVGAPTTTGTGASGTWNISVSGNAATVTNGVYTTDTGTVTNTMLAGSIANNKLTNSAITINGASTSLGGSVNVGTVTAVSGTAPIASTGGTTPTVSISQSGTTTDGYLSSTDWNTFNSKTANTGTVTSVAASAGTGISVSGSPITTSGTLTITNTAPDQVVSLTDGGTTTITGTYPNFTITSEDQFDGTVTSVAASAGTGISVSGSPITSSGTITITNTAPDQVVSLTGAGTTNVTGTYPNFTITSDDQFDGTVTSVAATAGTGISVSGSPITSSGTLTITNTAPDQVVSITGAGTSVVTGTYPTFTVTSDDQFDGTVTSVGGTGSVNGISLSGTVTSSGNLTLGGSLSGVSLTTQVSGTLPIANGGTNATTAPDARTSLGLGTSAVLNAAVALGTATLDAGGTVPLNQIPASIQGGLIYQGTWNASTNTPTLTSSVGTKGHYYAVSVAGSTNLNGITDWNIGDLAVYNGTAWEQIDNTDAVTSVNGYTGSVVLTTSDVAEGANQYFTTARARSSVSAGTGISYNSITGVITNSLPSLGGDVVGAASSTDNAITRFDGTTGKLIQNSSVIIDDTNNVTGVNSLTATTLIVNDDTTLGGSNTDTLTVNARIATDLDPETNNARDIGTNGRNWRDGFFGRTLQTVNLAVTGTTSFDGAQGTSGQVLTSAGSGNTPTWTTPTTGTVTSVAATAGTGISVSGSPITSSGTLTITNTAPDQTVVLTAGTGISTSGTYPNFTITNTSPSLGGDVVGAASSTDNAVARYDGTTGKIIQNSAVTIADDGATIIAANSTSDGLRITQTGTGNALLVEDAANPDATPFVISANGSVIQGTTQTYPVTSGGSSFTPPVQVQAANANSPAMGYATFNWASTTGSGAFTFAKSRGGTIGTHSVVSSGDVIGSTYYYGSDGTNFIPAALIEGEVDGTPGTNDMPGRLVFATTADGASSPTERMRITSAGNVGIGIAAPTAQLHLSKGGGTLIKLGTSLNTSQIEARESGGSNLLVLSSNNNSDSMVIDFSGNVGIGTSSPSARLEVAAPTNCTIKSTGLSGYGAFHAIGSGTNFSYMFFGNAGGEKGRISSEDNGNLIFSNTTSATERMRIDSSGNVGIGVTPSAWWSGSKAIQLGQGTTIEARTSTNTALFGSNVFVNSSALATYINTAPAARYVLVDGTHGWQIAPSGTAGNTISFTQAMTLDSSGNLLVGTTSTYSTGRGYITSIADGVTAYGINIKNISATNTVFALWTNSSNVQIGAIAQSGSTVAYNTSSDYRLKENVAPMQNALATVAALKPVTYTWKADGSAGQGFIAHELQAVVPDAVTGQKDAMGKDGAPNYQGVDTSFLVATLVSAIQEQQALIQDLTTRLNALEGN